MGAVMAGIPGKAKTVHPTRNRRPLSMRLPWVGNVYAALAEEDWQRLRVGPGSLARDCRARNPAAVAASADALGHGPAGAAWSYWHQCRLWVARAPPIPAVHGALFRSLILVAGAQTTKGPYNGI